MALLEGPPVIAEELREGVFVDPLPGGCHSARLYHGLAPRSTRLCPSSAPLSPSSLPIATGGEGILKKRKFLYAPGRGALGTFGSTKSSQNCVETMQGSSGVPPCQVSRRSGGVDALVRPL